MIRFNLNIGNDSRILQVKNHMFQKPVICANKAILDSYQIAQNLIRFDSSHFLWIRFDSWFEIWNFWWFDSIRDLILRFENYSIRFVIRISKFFFDSIRLDSRNGRFDPIRNSKNLDSCDLYWLRSFSLRSTYLLSASTPRIPSLNVNVQHSIWRFFVECA